MEVKFKRLHKNAVLPRYAKYGDAGLDLTATTKHWDTLNRVMVYGTGIAAEIPEGYVGLVFPRSSIFKLSLSLANAVGVIDSGYRGEIIFMFKESDEQLNYYDPGDRIGQLIIVPFPAIMPEWSDDLSQTDRGNSGYGSSGK